MLGWAMAFAARASLKNRTSSFWSPHSSCRSSLIATLPEQGFQLEVADPAADERGHAIGDEIPIPERSQERALEGMRYEEVASHLGVRLGTVGTRILRARRLLRRRLLDGPAKTASVTTRPRARAAHKRVLRSAARRAGNVRAAAA
jgi:hypothetical protein